MTNKFIGPLSAGPAGSPGPQGVEGPSGLQGNIGPPGEWASAVTLAY